MIRRTETVALDRLCLWQGKSYERKRNELATDAPPDPEYFSALFTTQRFELQNVINAEFSRPLKYS